MISEQPLKFFSGKNPNLGMLQIRRGSRVLRCLLDGQHRLLALSAQTEKDLEIDVPAVLFDSLDPRQTVELFVTIMPNTPGPSLASRLLGRSKALYRPVPGIGT